MTVGIVIQKAIYKRLTSLSEITSYVPPKNILDRNQRPIVDPLVSIGEDQIIDDGSDLNRCNWRVYSTIHVWKKEDGLTTNKAISGAIKKGIQSSRPNLGEGYHCADWRVTSERFMRDHDGIHSHGIITIESLVIEVQP